MYHPLAMDQIRLQNEELRRRAARRWVDEPVEQPQPGASRARRSVLALAFAGVTPRSRRRACADC